MSEIGEPPAKVLKVDNEDNIPQVKEAPELSESYDTLDDEMMGEESGIIEGGADVEPGESQEEWLSEGILTDDDYNPASQENNRTESQLGTSHDEENINESFERLDTTAESEPNNAEGEENVTGSDANIADCEANITENDANVTENDANVTENDANVTENDANVTENDSNVTECEANVTENEANVTECEANITESEANITQSEENIEKAEVDEALNETNAEKSETSIESDENTSKVEVNLSNAEQKIDILKSLLENKENLNESDDTAEPNMIESQTFTQPEEIEAVNSNTKPKESKENKADNSETVAKSEEDGQTNRTEKKDNKVWIDLNIEEAMKHLDGSKDTDTNADSIENLLSKKTEIKVEKKVITTEKQESDGNDTDDLLRMLEADDGKTKKKLTKTVADIRASAKSGNVSSDDDDDDDFVYEGAAKKLKAAKSALSRKQPMRARSEDLDDGDDENDVSPDETIQKMFSSKSKPNILKQKTSSKNFKPNIIKQTPAKNIVHLIERPQNTKLQTPAFKQYHNKRIAHNAKSILKPTPPKQGSVTNSSSFAEAKKVEVKNTVIPRLGIKTPAPFKPSVAVTRAPAAAARGAKPDFAEEELMERDEFEDEDEMAESDIDMTSHRQRIMKPETMDEEIPSDIDSHSEDGSLYDELPSSDSEDCDDWFQIDIRAEKAGDYLPLLGAKAKEVLLAEKQRVSSRLLTLKQSHTALCESGKKQAEQLREATMALAELDDMLKAS